MSKYIDRVLAEVKEKNANEPEFLQFRVSYFVQSTGVK